MSNMGLVSSMFLVGLLNHSFEVALLGKGSNKRWLFTPLLSFQDVHDLSKSEFWTHYDDDSVVAVKVPRLLLFKGCISGLIHIRAASLGQLIEIFGDQYS